MKSFSGAIGAALLLPVALAQQSSGLPVVDLGYEVHQASDFNQSAQIYNFSNIRYAQPPLGNLRWAAPVSPTLRNSTVTTGPSIGPVCPQANPAWLYIAAQFLEALVNGSVSSFNYTAAQASLQSYLASAVANPAPPDPRITEDCLFLDVIVPKSVFDNAHNKHKRGRLTGGAGGAPVLVWIYGGGYTGGSKVASGNPSGLIKASQKAGNPILFVAMNYRLGAFGFLAGPTLQGSGGVSNAGFYDQRLAIEWVKTHISKFGGDPSKITIMGESAGGGSVEHQITAYGNSRGVSFQRAILQSPAFLPTPSQAEQENVTQAYLKLLNVSTIAQARQLSSATLINANAYQVLGAPYGDFYYGPVVDGIFVPALPGLLLNAGAFAKDVQIMDGHNTNEAPLFTPPYVQSTSALQAWIEGTYPGIPPSTIDYLTNTLYPADYSGKYPWRSPLARTMAIIADSAFTCNNNYVNRAFNNQTYAYEFQVPPAFHGYDIPYTFYNGQGSSPSAGLFAPVAEVLQGYIVNFAANGNPNGAGLPPFPIQGMNASMNGLNVTAIGPVTDPTVNSRCAWWQKALYY